MARIAPLLVVLLVTGCELVGPDDPRSDGRSLYRTSFEPAADTTGWEVGGPPALRREAPPGGGRHAALVAGGCVWPHLARTLEAPRDGRLVLRLWGRDLAIGGGVTLHNRRSDARISVAVRDSTWTRYESSDTLAVRRGDALSLALGAGGIVASAMLVDRLEVAWVE